MLRLVFWLVVFSADSILTARADVALLASHTPTHPGSASPLSLRAEAEGDVDRVTLAYERFSLEEGPGGVVQPTLVEPLTVVRTCDPPDAPASLLCEETIAAGFPAGSFVRFTATVFGRDGTSRSETYSFAAGTFPWPDRPVPVRITGSLNDRLDIVLIPDTDLPLSDFVSGLHGVIHDLYYRYYIYKGDNKVI
jgi:hypothetical protein